MVINREISKKKLNKEEKSEQEVMELFDCQNINEEKDFATDKKLLTGMTDTNSKSEVKKLTEIVNKNMIQVMDELHDLESEHEKDRIVQNLFVKETPGLYSTAEFSVVDNKFD